MGGGGGKSQSTASSSNQQTSTDNRQAVQGGTAVGAGGSNSQTSNSVSNSTSLTQYLADNSTKNTTTVATSDSHSITDSGNTTLNYTGTDPGAVQITALGTQLAQAAGEQNLQALSGLENLQAQGSQNNLVFASHSLDVVGDLIDKMASATALGANAQIYASQTSADTSQAASDSQKQMSKYFVMGGIALAVAILARK